MYHLQNINSGVSRNPASVSSVTSKAHLGVMHDSRDSEAKAPACRTAEVSLPARRHEVWGQNGRWTLVVGRYTREELVQRRNEGDALYARREIGRDGIFLQRKRPGKAQFWNMLYTDVVGGL